MIAIIFESWVDPDDESIHDAYLQVSARMEDAVQGWDGFLGIERFQSTSDPNKFVSIAFFRDEEAVAAWRNLPAHRGAQAFGRNRFYRDYRLRVAEVLRDYGMNDRAQAPDDSRRHHDARSTP